MSPRPGASTFCFVIDGINPEPWAIGPLSMGRKVGGYYPKIGPNAKLVAYQEALREELNSRGASAYMLNGEVELTFFFCRNIAPERTATGRAKRPQRADVTNLQKATEDAIQGILITNDRFVATVSSSIIEQSETCEPKVIILVTQATDYGSPSHWLKLVEDYLTKGLIVQPPDRPEVASNKW